MKRNPTGGLLAVSALCAAALLSPVAHAAGQDHPLLSGMPSHKVSDRGVVDFGAYTEKYEFNCSPTRKCNANDPGFGPSGRLVAEGKVTTVYYASKDQVQQPLAVTRNYEAAIKSIGGRKLTWLDGDTGRQVFLVEQGGRRTWVVLDTDLGSSYQLTYIEEKAMQQVVTAGQLADAINKQGFATLYINFDNNSAVIKPDAKPAVDEIAALLAKDKNLRLSIEGHTDNVGNAAANKTLSEARAASVLKTLVQAKVDAKRLQSKGFGSEVSIADNRLEDGRAKNRRVELVKLK